MNVQDLLKEGASVKVYFYDFPGKEEAIKKLREYTDGEIKYASNKGYQWVEVEQGDLNIVIFYDEKTKK